MRINTKKTGLIKIVIALMFLMLSTEAALAGTATVSWNPNGETDLAGYKIYYGKTPRTGTCPSGGYSGVVDAGKVTSYVFNNLGDGSTYYFSVTAYNTSGGESTCSSEVSKAIPVPQKVYTISDFSSFMGDWLNSTKTAGDVNEDGKVDTRDLGVMMSNWGG